MNAKQSEVSSDSAREQLLVMALFPSEPISRKLVEKVWQTLGDTLTQRAAQAATPPNNPMVLDEAILSAVSMTVDNGLVPRLLRQYGLSVRADRRISDTDDILRCLSGAQTGEHCDTEALNALLRDWRVIAKPRNKLVLRDPNQLTVWVVALIGDLVKHVIKARVLSSLMQKLTAGDDILAAADGAIGLFERDQHSINMTRKAYLALSLPTVFAVSDNIGALKLVHGTVPLFIAEYVKMMQSYFEMLDDLEKADPHIVTLSQDLLQRVMLSSAFSPGVWLAAVGDVGFSETKQVIQRVAGGDLSLETILVAGSILSFAQYSNARTTQPASLAMAAGQDLGLEVMERTWNGLMLYLDDLANRGEQGEELARRMVSRIMAGLSSDLQKAMLWEKLRAAVENDTIAWCDTACLDRLVTLQPHKSDALFYAWRLSQDAQFAERMAQRIADYPGTIAAAHALAAKFETDANALGGLTALIDAVNRRYATLLAEGNIQAADRIALQTPHLMPLDVDLSVTRIVRQLFDTMRQQHNERAAPDTSNAFLMLLAMLDDGDPFAVRPATDDGSRQHGEWVKSLAAVYRLYQAKLLAAQFSELTRSNIRPSSSLETLRDARKVIAIIRDDEMPTMTVGDVEELARWLAHIAGAPVPELGMYFWEWTRPVQSGEHETKGWGGIELVIPSGLAPNSQADEMAVCVSEGHDGFAEMQQDIPAAVQNLFLTTHATMLEASLREWVAAAQEKAGVNADAND